MSNKPILVTGATGDTGRNVVRFLLEKNHKVRAFVHKIDSRSEQLRKDGAEVVEGNLLNLDDVSAATKGAESAYFCYPLRPKILQATAYFAQAARENSLSAIVNMSQISARRDASSHAAQDHWIAEQVFNWSGTPVTHVRPTFFAEWLLYLSPIISEGSMSVPFEKGRHAPIAAEDQARVIANILDKPNGHAGKVYPLYGPRELSQQEIAAEISLALGRTIEYKFVDFDSFMDRWKSAGQTKRADENVLAENKSETQDGYTLAESSSFFVQHIREVTIDHGNGIFAGTNDVVPRIGGVPGTTVKEFVEKHRQAFELKN
jgi:NAD(P)H dehydrogenase (quinone)